MAANKDLLLGSGTRLESRQIFARPPVLADLGQLLHIVFEEIVNYRVWPVRRCFAIQFAVLIVLINIYAGELLVLLLTPAAATRGWSIRSRDSTASRSSTEHSLACRGTIPVGESIGKCCGLNCSDSALHTIGSSPMDLTGRVGCLATSHLFVFIYMHLRVVSSYL